MQRSISSAGLAGCILVILFSITSETAWAQADITPETGRAQGSVLEEITVTARKRNESLQDIPMAISAWSAVRKALMPSMKRCTLRYESQSLLSAVEAAKSIVLGA